MFTGARRMRWRPTWSLMHLRASMLLAGQCPWKRCWRSR